MPSLPVSPTRDRIRTQSPVRSAGAFFSAVSASSDCGRTSSSASRLRIQASARVRERFVTCPGKVVAPLALENQRAEAACNFDCAIGGPGVDDDDLVGHAGDAAQRRFEKVLFVFDDHADRQAMRALAEQGQDRLRVGVRLRQTEVPTCTRTWSFVNSVVAAHVEVADVRLRGLEVGGRRVVVVLIDVQPDDDRTELRLLREQGLQRNIDLPDRVLRAQRRVVRDEIARLMFEIRSVCVLVAGSRPGSRRLRSRRTGS